LQYSVSFEKNSFNVLHANKFQLVYIKTTHTGTACTVKASCSHGRLYNLSFTSLHA